MTRWLILFGMAIVHAGCSRTEEPVTMSGSPQSPATPALQTTLTQGDVAFLHEAARGGRMEVELGRMAVERAGSEDVRRFGERMVRDHSRANDRLMDLAEQKALAVPRELAAEQQDMIRHLTEARGADFDRAYMRHMVEDHETDVALFRRMAGDAADPDVRAFAAQTLPVLEEHLRMAREIHNRLAGPANRP
jgi:putative membrane protein